MLREVIEMIILFKAKIIFIIHVFIVDGFGFNFFDVVLVFLVREMKEVVIETIVTELKHLNIKNLIIKLLNTKVSKIKFIGIKTCKRSAQ